MNGNALSVAAACALVVILSLSTALWAGGKTPRPSDQAIESALRTVVQLTLSQKDLNKRVAGATATATLVSELVGNGDFDTAVARLEKKGIAVTEALGSMARSMKSIQCRSMQAEAKMNLDKLFIAQEMHRGEWDRYEKKLKKLDFSTGAQSRFRYEVIEASATSFKARATGVSAATRGEVWEITDKRDLKNVATVCAP